MIHVLTVYWGDDAWPDIQAAWLRRTTHDDYRIFAFGGEHSPPGAFLSAGPHRFVPDYGIRPHPVKLNLLAQMASLASQRDDDLLVFLDSDAFPIRPWVNVVRPMLAEYPLVAVRRDENYGERQPHPSFCVTTIGFWRTIEGDWRQGYQWTNSVGERTSNVGGNLLGQLEEGGHRWRPLLRSAQLGTHPVFFAVYGDLVYHHGAGSRDAICQLDKRRASEGLAWPTFFPERRSARRLQEIAAANARESEAIMRRLAEADDFATLASVPCRPPEDLHDTLRR